MKLSYLSFAVYPVVVTNQPDQRLREIRGKIKTRFIGFHGKLSCENWYSLEFLYPLNVDMKLYLSFAVYPVVVTNQPDQRLREIGGRKE